ncbi:MAG: hydrolase [Candidatus Kapaibacteriota bacterium]|jgi:nicotinamidase-related amidase
MRILTENTQAILVDVQEKLFHHIYDFQNLETNINKLLQGLMNLDIPFLISEQYTKGLGHTILSLRETIDSLYQPLEKMEFSCADNLTMLNKINEIGRKNILLFGIETHVCILQTAIDLKEKGYIPIVIEDCVSSRNINDKKIAIERLKSEGVIISTMESILFELCRVSGTDRFKSISKLVK